MINCKFYVGCWLSFVDGRHRGECLNGTSFHSFDDLQMTDAWSDIVMESHFNRLVC